MASSAVAFRKFETWKNLKTDLRVTVVTNGGKPDSFEGKIFGVEESSEKVGFADFRTRGVAFFDLSGATFKLGKKSLEASRSAEDFITFVEK